MKHLWFLPVVLMLVSCGNKKNVSQGVKGDGLFAKKKILAGATITSLSVEKFPRYGMDGEKWDAYAPFKEDADVFIRIQWNAVEFYRSETKTECEYGKSVSFAANLPLVIKPFDQLLLLEVMDEDGISGDDNMGYFDVLLMDHKDKSEIILTGQNGELIVKMGLVWKYE